MLRRQTDRLIKGCTDRQIDRHANRQTDTQTYGQSQEAIIPKKLSEQIACLIFFLNGYKFSLMSWLKTAIKLSWKLCSIKNHFQFEEVNFKLVFKQYTVVQWVSTHLLTQRLMVRIWVMDETTEKQSMQRRALQQGQKIDMYLYWSNKVTNLVWSIM